MAHSPAGPKDLKLSTTMADYMITNQNALLNNRLKSLM